MKKSKVKNPDPRKLKSPLGDERSSAACHHNRLGWRELPLGGVITQAGNSKQYNTGNWVKSVAKWNPKTCINCNLCWPVCPDEAILVDQKGNMIGVDPEKCKACGLCVTACPTKPKSLEIVAKQAAEI